jgi:hypothetical protein
VGSGGSVRHPYPPTHPPTLPPLSFPHPHPKLYPSLYLSIFLRSFVLRSPLISKVQAPASHMRTQAPSQAPPTHAATTHGPMLSSPHSSPPCPHPPLSLYLSAYMCALDSRLPTPCTPSSSHAHAQAPPAAGVKRPPAQQLLRMCLGRIPVWRRVLSLSERGGGGWREKERQRQRQRQRKRKRDGETERQRDREKEIGRLHVRLDATAYASSRHP